MKKPKQQAAAPAAPSVPPPGNSMESQYSALSERLEGMKALGDLQQADVPAEVRDRVALDVLEDNVAMRKAFAEADTVKPEPIYINPYPEFMDFDPF